MNKTVFITGVSSGLGYGFAECYLERGWHIYGISRRVPETLIANSNFHFRALDVREFENIPRSLEVLFDTTEKIDLAILNAAILGEIRDISQTHVQDLRRLMDINVWANKIILDFLMAGQFAPRQIVAISSGASVNGNRGWGGYSISKSALNMLTQLYAREYPGSHFTALAPGLIDTAMQDYLCENADEQQFPTVKILKAARNTPSMPQPKQAAGNIITIFPKLLKFESGSYTDIRTL